VLPLIVEVNSRLKLANCLFLPLNSTLAQGQAYGHRGSRQLWGVRQISFEIVESHWDITPFLSLLILLAFCLGAGNNHASGSPLGLKSRPFSNLGSGGASALCPFN